VDRRNHRTTDHQHPERGDDKSNLTAACCGEHPRWLAEYHDHIETCDGVHRDGSHVHHEEDRVQQLKPYHGYAEAEIELASLNI